MKHLLLIGVLYIMSFLVNTFTVRAQADSLEKKERFLRHRLTGVIGHALQPTALEDGQKKWLALASWGLDYDYKLCRKWAIGLHSDVILQNFNVEEAKSVGGDKSKVLQRKNPLAICAVGIYKPTRHLSLVGGLGEEFSFNKGENLFIVRAGFEYGYEIMEKYEVGFSLNYDAKIDAYSTIVLGLGVSKLF
jgi:hypothetical protein